MSETSRTPTLTPTPTPALVEEQRPAPTLLRSVAIAAAMIAGCSVVLATLLAWRLLDARERRAIAAAQCSCCGESPMARPGEVDGAQR